MMSGSGLVPGELAKLDVEGWERSVKTRKEKRIYPRVRAAKKLI